MAESTGLVWTESGQENRTAIAESTSTALVVSTTESEQEEAQGLDSVIFRDYNPSDPDAMFPFGDNFLYSNEELSQAMLELTETFDMEWIEEFIDYEGRIAIRPLEPVDHGQSIVSILPDDVASTCELKHPVPSTSQGFQTSLPARTQSIVPVLRDQVASTWELKHPVPSTSQGFQTSLPTRTQSIVPVLRDQVASTWELKDPSTSTYELKYTVPNTTPVFQTSLPAAPQSIVPVLPDDVPITCELKHPVPNTSPVFQTSLPAVPISSSGAPVVVEPAPFATIVPKTEMEVTFLPTYPPWPQWSDADSTSEKGKAYVFPKIEVVGYTPDTESYNSYSSEEDSIRHSSQEELTSSSGTEEPVSSTTSQPYTISSSKYWEDPRVALGLIADSASTCGYSTIDFTCLSYHCPSSSVETKRKNAVSTPNNMSSLQSKVNCQTTRGKKRKVTDEETSTHSNPRNKKPKDFRDLQSIRELFDSPVKNRCTESPSKITLTFLLKGSKKPAKRNGQSFNMVRDCTVESTSSAKTSKNVSKAPSIVIKMEEPQPAPVYYSYEFIVSHGLKAGRSGRGLKPYVCPVPECDKTYKNANGLKYHARYGHSPRQEFPCESCNKVYTTRHGLMAHLKTHPGYVKPKNETKVKTLKITSTSSNVI